MDGCGMRLGRMAGVPPARGREGSTAVTFMQGTVLSSQFPAIWPSRTMNLEL